MPIKNTAHCPPTCYAHTAAAHAVGVPAATIDAVLSGAADQLSAPEYAAAHQFTVELVSDRSVTDDTYTRVIHLLGRDAVLDMVTLISIYLATSALLNAFEVPV